MFIANSFPLKKIFRAVRAGMAYLQEYSLASQAIPTIEQYRLINFIGNCKNCLSF